MNLLSSCLVGVVASFLSIVFSKGGSQATEKRTREQSRMGKYLMCNFCKINENHYRKVHGSFCLNQNPDEKILD